MIGLTYIEKFIDQSAADCLLATIDASPWRSDLKRRVQHYGYRYDYKTRQITGNMRLGALPEWLSKLAGRVVVTGGFDSAADQVIINEYVPGQGISPHIDCVPCFGEVVATVSLESGVEMIFARGQEKVRLYLEPCSLLVMTGEARYGWTHGIAARKSDVRDGVRVQRGRRVSVTFRTVVAA